MAVRSSWKKHIIKVLVMVTMCFGVAAWNPPFLTFSFRAIVGTIALPFQSVFAFAGYQVGQVGSFFSSVGDLKSENERLTRENLELLARNALLADREKENESLRSELGLLPRDRFEFVSAEVIGRGDVLSDGSLILNVGDTAGVRPGMAVVVGKSVLIGRIVETTPLSSFVRPLSSSASTISAMDGATEAKGIVRGEYGLGLVFDRVLQSDMIRDGDEVVTSGLGGDLPQGLLIGTIVAREPSVDQLFQRATIVSPVRFEHLRSVAILVNIKS